MKKPLKDAELTAYALNELDPRRRRTIETRLAYDYEARQDIYAIQEVASLLEEGFEREAQPFLTITQRHAILRAEEAWLRRRRAVRAVAMVAGLGVAAGIVLAAFQSGMIKLREPGTRAGQALHLPAPPAAAAKQTAPRGSTRLTLNDPRSEQSVSLDAASDGAALPWPATLENSLRPGIPATVPIAPRAP